MDLIQNNMQILPNFIDHLVVFLLNILKPN